MESVDDPNEKIAYLRSCIIIGALVNRCAEAFLCHEEQILRGQFRGSLLDHIPDPEHRAYRDCEALSRKKDLLRRRCGRHRACRHTHHIIPYPRTCQSRLQPRPELLAPASAKVPEQYEVDSPGLYGKLQAVLDHISGMTDVYALDLYSRLKGMSLKINN